MPITRELSFTYAGVTIGGSSARQILDWTKEGGEYESGYFECEFVTTAATAAAFKTELDTIRDAFRKPRQDLVVTQESQTILSKKHSDNTGLDTYPEITKDGDLADTGRSRHFRIRVSYGQPADNVSTSFRRNSTVTVDYDESRRRTVTISGVYTANSTDGVTGSYGTYSAGITTYATTVLAGTLMSDGTFEKIGEPDITRGETDKVMNFTVVFREILFNQAIGTLDDLDIVNPVMVIEREREAPGDSVTGGASVSGASVGSFPAGSVDSGGYSTVVAGNSTTSGDSSSIARPVVFTVSYTCGIDSTRTKNLLGKWTNVIRGRLISMATGAYKIGLVVVVEEKPAFDDYANRISATMKFIAFTSSTITRQEIRVKDSTTPGWVFVGVYTKDPYDYYEFPGPAVRIRTISESRSFLTTEPDANKVVDGLVLKSLNATVGNITGGDHWRVINQTPGGVSLRKGLSGDGGTVVYEATVEIETTAQYRNARKPSTANAGGITGSTVTL